MIYDCFTFFNELDLLELRLRELYSVVDQFVLCESVMTHSGKDKPLYFEGNKDRFKQWLPKIRHQIVRDPVLGNEQHHAWQREGDQRNLMAKGIMDAKDDDLIMVSDLDEIISARSISTSLNYALRMVGKNRPIHFSQRAYYRKMTYRWRLDWHKAGVCYANMAREIGFQSVRHSPLFADEMIPDGGWHFTYMGKIPTVIEKIEGYAHACEPQSISASERLRNGMDTDGFDVNSCRKVLIDETFPNDVFNHQHYWSEKGLFDLCHTDI